MKNTGNVNTAGTVTSCAFPRAKKHKLRFQDGCSIFFFISICQLLCLDDMFAVCLVRPDVLCDPLGQTERASRRCTHKKGKGKESVPTFWRPTSLCRPTVWLPHKIPYLTQIVFFSNKKNVLFMSSIFISGKRAETAYLCDLERVNVRVNKRLSGRSK